MSPSRPGAAGRRLVGLAMVLPPVDLVATLWATALSTVLVVVLAWGIGLYLRLSESWAAKALSALSVVPLFIPVVIASYVLLASGLAAASSAAPPPTWGWRGSGSSATPCPGW